MNLLRGGGELVIFGICRNVRKNYCRIWSFVCTVASSYKAYVLKQGILDVPKAALAAPPCRTCHIYQGLTGGLLGKRAHSLSRRAPWTASDRYFLPDFTLLFLISVDIFDIFNRFNKLNAFEPTLSSLL